jgi:hypothetical protein
MKNITIMTLFLSALLLLFNQCSNESNPVSEDNPVIDPISNQWTDTSLAGHTFDLTTYDSTVSKGIFFGTEFHPDSFDVQAPPIHGYFDKTYVEFDVIWTDNFGSRKRVKYKGNFVNSRLINLQSLEGKRLVISKN